MMKISLQSLIKILTRNNINFTIEKSKRLGDVEIIRFICGTDYASGSRIFNKKYRDELCSDGKNGVGGWIQCHYDLTRNEILSCCENWYNLIRDAKLAATKKIEEKNEDKKIFETTVQTSVQNSAQISKAINVALNG